MNDALRTASVVEVFYIELIRFGIAFDGNDLCDFERNEFIKMCAHIGCEGRLFFFGLCLLRTRFSARPFFARFLIARKTLFKSFHRLIVHRRKVYARRTDLRKPLRFSEIAPPKRTFRIVRSDTLFGNRFAEKRSDFLRILREIGCRQYHQIFYDIAQIVYELCRFFRIGVARFPRLGRLERFVSDIAYRKDFAECVF